MFKEGNALEEERAGKLLADVVLDAETDVCCDVWVGEAFEV